MFPSMSNQRGGTPSASPCAFQYPDWAARIRIADWEQSVGLKNYGAVLSLLVIVEAVEKGKQRRGKKPGLPL